ncbi:MAG: NAD(+)/NADH kinase [Porticoccaceae bacterium]
MAKTSLGIIVNPLSGRDCRRLTARADTVSHENKRNQIARIVVGAVAAGCQRILVPWEPRRLAVAAVEHLCIGAEVEQIRVPITHSAEDTRQAVLAMRERGCTALVVLGGDGTSRIVAKAWRDAVMMPLSTGTNNVFPLLLEPTLAGMAAGLVASGRIDWRQATQRAKVITVEIDGEAPDLALVDALFLQNDRIGNLGPFEPEHMKTLVLTRAEPAAVGMSPLGGLLVPSGATDDFGVRVDFCSHRDGGQVLLAPVSPGLFRSTHIRAATAVALEQEIEIRGPGILAFDGDRERALAAGQLAKLKVSRSGPWVIDPQLTLRLAAENKLMLDLPHWVDPYDDDTGKGGCC